METFRNFEIFIVVPKAEKLTTDSIRSWYRQEMSNFILLEEAWLLPNNLVRLSVPNKNEICNEISSYPLLGGGGDCL